ncbi:serine protease 27-like [Tetranychus urticae]|uniref:Peptidase S1 domain-containing protein n=1 Tax=Tetranychus urticae TaxID=32264 RepID=T1L3F0_TETUR|nr:serine protease 27-like [Tetranychus urticae]XP_015793306.2 serine protease 27-like [Tetranychus urticae]
MKNPFVSSHPHLSLVKLEMNSFVPLLLFTLPIISNGLHLSYKKSQSTFQSYDNELTDQVCGRDTIPGKMPFYASIEADDPTKHFKLCNGVLIANRWVLTPAHFIFSSFESIRVVLGDKWNKKTIGVESAHFLPDLDRKTPMNNIALLLLKEPVQFSRNIQPICLPEPGETFYGRYGTLAGWTERNPTERKLPSSMHTTSLPIIRSGDCRRFYDKPEFIDKNLTDSLFCAGYPEGPKDACPKLGDPLMVKVRKHWVIAGITVANMSCWRSHALDAYLRVGFFLDWIKSTIEKYNS